MYLENEAHLQQGEECGEAHGPHVDAAPRRLEEEVLVGEDARKCHEAAQGHGQPQDPRLEAQ